MTRRKSLIWAGAALAALLLVVALVIPLLIDVERYRDEITGAAGEALGREVAIDGDLSLSLLPSVKLRAEGLRLANAAGPGFSDGPMARIAAVDVELALLPLLSGRFEVARFVLKEPDILLERTADGRTNWAFETSPDPAPEPADSDGAGPEIIAERIAIQNGRLLYRDGTSETLIEAIDAELRLGSLSGPFEGRLALTYAGTHHSLDLSLGRLGDGPTPLTLASSLAGKPLRFSGSLTPNPDAPRLEGELTFGNSNGRVSLAAALGETTEIAVGIDLARIDLADFSAPAGREDGTTAAPGAIPLALPQNVAGSLDLTIGEIAGAPVAVGPISLEAHLAGGVVEITRLEAAFPGPGNLSAQGTLASRSGAADLDLGLTLATDDLGALADLPDAAPKGLRLAAALRLEGDRIGLSDIDLRAGDIHARGRAGYVLAARPQAAAEIEVDRLDLAPWLAGGSTSAAAAPAQPSAPPAFPALAGIDGGLDVRISRLENGRTEIGPAALSARLDRGTLMIDRFSLGREGTLALGATGRVTDLASAPRYDLDITASGAGLDRALTLADAEAPEALAAAGPFRMTGRLSGTADALAFDLDSRMGDLTARAKGRADGLRTAAPTVNAELSGGHRSLAALAAQFGVDGLPAGADAKPLEFGGTLTHTESRSEGAVTLSAGAGRLLTRFEQAGETTTASLEARADELRTFLRDLGIDYSPARADPGSLDLSLGLTHRGDALTLAPIGGRIGPVTLEGSGRADLSGEVPRITLELAAGDMPLDDLLPPSETGVEAVAEHRGERWSDEPLDLEILAAVDGTATLSAKSLTINGYRFEEMRLAAASEGRRLEVRELSGRLFGGNARIIATLDAAAVPHLSTGIDLAGVDLDSLMQTAVGNRPASGTVSLTGRFEGRGASEKAIVASLSGSGHFGAEGGVVRGVDLVALNRRMGTLTTIADFARVTGTALGGGETAYRHIGFDLVAERGILRTENFMADMDGADTDFNATVDLPEWTIDAQGRFALKDRPDAPPVGATVRGPLDTPTIVYETERLKQWVAARLGTAVIRGVAGEGVGLGDFLFGGTPPAGETSASDPQGEQDEPVPVEGAAPTPAQDLNNLGNTLLRGLFGGKREEEKKKDPDGGTE